MDRLCDTRHCVVPFGVLRMTVKLSDLIKNLIEEITENGDCDLHLVWDLESDTYFTPREIFVGVADDEFLESHGDGELEEMKGKKVLLIL